MTSKSTMIKKTVFRERRFIFLSKILIGTCILISLVLFSCKPKEQPVEEETPVPPRATSEIPDFDKSDQPKLNELLTQTDAEKILGDSVKLATKGEKPNEIYQAVYIAKTEPKDRADLTALYFFVENYATLDESLKRYSFIKKANEKHKIVVLDNLGEEAYFHSDNKTFYFILVRKGNKVMNLKVHKLSKTTSLEEFNAVARRITNEM